MRPLLTPRRNHSLNYGGNWLKSQYGEFRGPYRPLLLSQMMLVRIEWFSPQLFCTQNHGCGKVPPISIYSFIGPVIPNWGFTKFYHAWHSRLTSRTSDKIAFMIYLARIAQLHNQDDASQNKYENRCTRISSFTKKVITVISGVLAPLRSGHLLARRTAAAECFEFLLRFYRCHCPSPPKYPVFTT